MTAGSAPQSYRCGLCSHEFAEGSETLCGSCPMHRGECGLVKCPQCGYEFPTGSRVVHWIRKILTPRRST